MSNQITPNPSVPSQVVQEVKFPKFVNNLGIIPTSYKDSMSYYETLAWLCKYLEETVIPTVNENGEAVEELQDLYVQLNDYVTHYFDTLDVQEEINNKLDDMVEAGTLQEIISAYLNSQAIFGYNNVNEMINAVNLQNGSYARTLGYYLKNDGGSGLYKIRTRTFEDSVDNGSIIEMNDETLVAELIITSNYINAKNFGAKNDLSFNNITALNNAISYCKNHNKTLLLDGYFKINSSLDTKGVKIIGEGKQIHVSPTYTSNTYGYLSYDYINNVNDGALVDFNDYCESTLISGSGIVSDTANPILMCDYKDGWFELENLSIIGWLRNENQQVGCESIITQTSSNYFRGIHHFNHVTVANCSGTGVKLHSLEQTELNNCNFQQNFGYGLHIEGFEVGSGKDAPFELVTFNKCFFDTNKLGGVYAENCYRSNVYFNYCDVGRSGLYEITNTNIPADITQIRSGVKITGWGGYTNPQQQTTNINIEFNNVFGEEMANLIYIDSYSSDYTHLFNNVTIRNCSSNNNRSSSNNCLLYINGNYFWSFSYYDNNFVSASGSEIIKGSNLGTIIPKIVNRVFYNTYDEVSLTDLSSSKITWTNTSFKKYGDVVFLALTGNVTDDIAQWENILSGFPAPPENFTAIALNNTNSTPFRVSFQANKQCITSAAIAKYAQITLTATYLTVPV